jgi:hypothetical protein
MKRLITLSVLTFALLFSSTARAESQFELLFGPRFNVKNYAGMFAVGGAFGGKYVKFGFNYSHGSQNFLGTNVGFNMIKPYVMIDIPIGFNIGSSTEMRIIPTIDFGPEIGFMAGEKVIDFMVLGFGIKAQIYFTDTFGVGITPFHLSNSFASYTTGGTGVDKTYRMTYDLYFSLLMKW